MGSREREPIKRIFNNLSEIPKRPEQLSPSVVILASESQRRTLAAKYLFPLSHVINMPGGEEPQTDDLVFIANRKLDHVLPRARPMIMQATDKRGIIIGTDVKVYTLAIDQEVGIKDRGKPKDELEVREIFEEMYEASQVAERDPYYIIRSSSTVVDFSRKQEYRKKYPADFTAVMLNADKIGYFSTQEGFDEYAKELEKFFSGQNYLNNGLKMPANISDITGGLDLPVLVRMGAVKALSFKETGDIDIHDEQFTPRLKQAIFSSTVGFDPLMIKPYEPKVEERIANWPWLQTIADYALNNPPQA